MNGRKLFYIATVAISAVLAQSIQQTAVASHEDVLTPAVIVAEVGTSTPVTADAITVVPFYSQFADISAPQWKKVGCGIASLAMLIDYYDESISVDTLLSEGITSGAYINNAGWSHAGLINLAKKHGLTGATRGYGHLSMTDAFVELEKSLDVGPVMASVHYTFDPKNPIPHLVVINDVRDGRVYYNDPAETSGGGSITIEKFKSSWKKRFIEIRPTV